LTFSNIPPDATRLWIHVSSWGDTEVLGSRHSYASSYASVTDVSVRGEANSTPQLDKVKQTGKVIFPAVRPGINYRFSATVYNEREFHSFMENQENFQPRSAYTDFIADNGIYVNGGNAKLEVNDTYSAVTISSEPIFSSEVIFGDQKYSFGVTISVDNNRSIGVGDHHFPDGLSSDGLTWTFEPQMTEDLRRDNSGWLETGSNYPAWAEARVNIIYDDIKWSVEIAKTSEFKYSL